ncbi:helix-turn-helix domain-containing protein [Ruminococcus sp.]
MSKLTYLYQMDLPHRAVAVYTYLHDRADKNGECFPSVKTIAGDIKLSPATVRRAIKDLKKAGLIETEQRYREKGGKSSLLFKLNNYEKANK